MIRRSAPNSKLLRWFGPATLVWLSLGLSVATAQLKTLPVPEVITSQQGLPQAFIPSILQDKQGFIWIATRDGLCRYDGNAFKVFQPSPEAKPSLSSAELMKMALDQQGKIWMFSQTGDLDLFDPAHETFINVSRAPFYRKAVGKQTIQSIYVDSQNKLWICFQHYGLACLDLTQQKIIRYRHQANKAGTLDNDTTQAILEDRTDKHMLWVSTYGGLNRLDRRNGHFTLVHSPTKGVGGLPKTQLKELYYSPDGNLLIRLNRHVSSVDQRTGTIRRTLPFPEPELIWHWTPIVVNQQHGVFLSQYNRLFRLDKRKGLQAVASLPEGINILSLFIDRSEVLWVGTNGGGIFKYNLRAGAFMAMPYQRSFQADLLVQQLKLTGLPKFNQSREWSYLLRSTVDSAGRIWCNVRDVPFMRFELSTRTVTNLPFVTNVFPKDPSYSIMMATDPQGHVWGLYDSLAAWYDEPQQRWIRFPHRFQQPPGARQTGGIPAETVILDFVVDDQYLWMISQADGLYRVDRQTGAIRHYTNRLNDPSSLSSNKLLCLFSDPADRNILWIGTYGSGLCRFDKRTGMSRRLTTADGLPNNVIHAAIPDREGALWVATNQGLGRMDRRTFKTRIYTHEDGLAGDEFNRHHWLALPDGRIFLGGVDGITIFNPAHLQKDVCRPLVQITGIQINGQPLATDSEPVHILTELTLPHDKNFVTVQFAGMQFNRRNRLRYRYQLEGLDDTWTETDRPLAVYTGLQPGHYVLRLNAANTEGVWSNHVRTLQLTIEPPFWATWWAYMLYALAAGGLTFGLLRAYVNRLKLQQSVEIKQKEVELKQQEAEQLRQSMELSQKEMALNQQETEQLRATNNLKNRFFANITHEFRTPLTLILAPTEQMMSEKPEPRARRRLVTIEQNAHQLLRLINQLLDLSRLEGGVMPIHEARGNLTDCIAHWLQPLIEQANAQHLALTFRSDVTGSYYFDAEKLERIVYNLTANALKFTPTGTIIVSLTDSSEQIQLTVSDTGIGIPAQDLPHIFDRFYQVGGPAIRPSLRRTGPAGSAAFPDLADGANEALLVQQPGTGIGLALVKELVQLQRGTITVDSTVGEGTTFVVVLPYRRAYGIGQEVARSIETPAAETSNRSSPLSDAELLIVEDNDELAQFIVESLSPTYRIRRAVNGRDGLEQAWEHLPDLVISDVMMPVQTGPIQAGPILSGPIQAGPGQVYQSELDGFALCSRLKTDLRTSHIPVILLTAKATQEDRMEGLSQGADDYLTKPFYVEELRLRVHNQLEHRRRQREWLRHQLTSADQPQPTRPEDPFLIRFYELLEANLSNTQLSVESLADQLALSRSHLHRKVKALTGFSANELVRNYRLKAATQLLRNGLNSAETADRVGFESPQYFAKCFRELYGLTPTEFVRNHRKQ